MSDFLKFSFSMWKILYPRHKKLRYHKEKDRLRILKFYMKSVSNTYIKLANPLTYQELV